MATSNQKKKKNRVKELFLKLARWRNQQVKINTSKIVGTFICCLGFVGYGKLIEVEICDRLSSGGVDY